MPRAVRPWFRVYVEMFSDRKIKRLTPTQRWIWVAVLAAARESCVPGVLMVTPLEPMSDHEIADFADVRLREVGPAIEAMTTLGMVLRNDSGALQVPSFLGRQFESDDVTKRTRAHRERSKERSNVVPRNVRRNTPETETDTETDNYKSPSDSDARTRAGDPEDFERFWRTYPRREGKAQAAKAWAKAIKLADVDKITKAAAAYRDDPNREDEFTAHAATWLNQERWDNPPLPTRLRPVVQARNPMPIMDWTV